MLVVTASCIFVEPTSGILAGILLSLGTGALMESKAWVLCKLRQGDEVLAQFTCDLVKHQYPSIFPPASTLHFHGETLFPSPSFTSNKHKFSQSNIVGQPNLLLIPSLPTFHAIGVHWLFLNYSPLVSRSHFTTCIFIFNIKVGEIGTRRPGHTM
jgi:hypothetical protein